MDEKQKLIDGCTVVNKESSTKADASLSMTEYKQDTFSRGDFRKVITSLYAEHEKRDRRWSFTSSDIGERDLEDGVSIADCGCGSNEFARFICIAAGFSDTCRIPSSQQSGYDEEFTLECPTGFAVTWFQGRDYKNNKGDRLFRGGCTKINGLKEGQPEGTREWSDYQNEFDESEFTWGPSSKGLPGFSPNRMERFCESKELDLA